VNKETSGQFESEGGHGGIDAALETIAGVSGKA
jgi:hypothetical protein